MDNASYPGAALCLHIHHVRRHLWFMADMVEEEYFGLNATLSDYSELVVRHVEEGHSPKFTACYIADKWGRAGGPCYDRNGDLVRGGLAADSAAVV